MGIQTTFEGEHPQINYAGLDESGVKNIPVALFSLFF